MKKNSLFCLFLIVVFAFSACGSDDDSSSSSNIFFEAAKNTAPVFDASSKKAPAGDNWNWGNPVYEIYTMFRDYDPNTDEGTIGLDNIYKLMYQAGQFFNSCDENGTSISDTPMTSPYILRSTSQTYDKYLIQESPDGANYFATKRDGDISYALLCWYIDNTTSEEYGILEGNYNESTHDIDIDLVCFVDYGATGTSSENTKFSLRTHLTGNSETHTFTDLRSSKWNWDDDETDQMYCAWYIGSGVSQGSGEYSLFRVSDNGGLNDQYFEIPADAAEADLQDLDDLGLDTSTLSYKTEVDTMFADDDYFDAISNIEIVIQASDFNGQAGSMGLMKPTEMP
ncbi:MAG: hypothetical protein JW864_00470 [Spirochaetes bacterium]|nr:hypothetical protein [Spirochaetota bacterium]